MYIVSCNQTFSCTELYLLQYTPIFKSVVLLKLAHACKEIIWNVCLCTRKVVAICANHGNIVNSLCCGRRVANFYTERTFKIHAVYVHAL